MTIDNSVRYVTKVNHSRREQPKVKDSKPNTRKRKVSEKKLSQNNT